MYHTFSYAESQYISENIIHFAGKPYNKCMWKVEDNIHISRRTSKTRSRTKKAM